MLLSLNWLREFVPYEGTGAEFGERLTMAGLELDGLERPYAGLRPIVVGYVAECGRHPEADKLSVCKVDVGDEVLDIVCGAPNVAQGQKVAVGKVGVTLPTGLTVKKVKLRGQPSHGMICSEFELGLSDDHDGILVLNPGAPVGASLIDVLGVDDEVLDVSVTPNRGDCLSVLGLAREVSAITGLPLRMPEFSRRLRGGDAAGAMAIEILQPELCPLYHGMLIESAASSQSPGWLRYRLQSVGVRAISNMVDATNYVLMELGQPLHAFDFDTLRGGRIIVRGADEGERFVTLDGQKRVLTGADITIRDAEGIVCIGGVMGGLDSEVTAATTRVFLESAIFNPPNIRRTARRLNLHSEAAFRFERGVDQGGATFALERAAHLMAELSGGYVRPGIMRAEPGPFKAPLLRLRKSRAEALLGVPLDSGFCADTLGKLGCGVSAAGSSGDTGVLWDVTSPSWRGDLTREADLIEEIVRIYGVDRIPPVLPDITRLLDRAGEPQSLHAFLSGIKHWGRGAGLSESITYSFVSHRELDFLEIPQEGRISIMNPLSDDLNVLRTHLAPGLLNSLRNNLSQGAPSVRLFEVAAAFTSDPSSDTTAREEARLGILLNGARFDQSWPQPEEDLDYLDLKGLVEHLLVSFSLPEARFELDGDGKGTAWLAPRVGVSIGDDFVGWLGKVKPEVADPYHAKKPVWLAELNLERLFTLHRDTVVRFVPLPVFPPVRRDITFISAPGVTAAAIIDGIKGLRLPLLSSVSLIDCFEPKDKEERNLTFRLTFRQADRTLKDSEADKQRDVVAAALTKALPVRV